MENILQNKRRKRLNRKSSPYKGEWQKYWRNQGDTDTPEDNNTSNQKDGELSKRKHSQTKEIHKIITTELLWKGGRRKFDFFVSGKGRSQH